jgi:hypothetical protein
MFMPFTSRSRARGASVVAAIALAGAVVLTPNAAQAAGTVMDDAYTVSAGSVFTTPAGQGILANDPGVDELALVSITGTGHGTLSPIGAGGTFRYLPADGFVGVDVFTYCVWPLPGTPCVTGNATVTLTVTSTIERIGGSAATPSQRGSRPPSSTAKHGSGTSTSHPARCSPTPSPPQRLREPPAARCCW